MKPPKITTLQMYRRFCKEEPESTKQTPMYDKINSCLRKKQFWSRDNATTFAVRMSSQTREEYESYRCRWCGLFHIGHSKEEVNNAHTLSPSS